MPQVDLESLVSVCGGGTNGDRKIACETLADSEDVPPGKPDVPIAADEVSPELPPESFWLSKDAEFDWFDRNAFYERKDSGKGNANSTNLNPNLNPSSNSSSQRFSRNLKSRTSIIGLPKTHSTSYVDSKRRNCKQVNIRLFPKRSESVGKSASDAEPSSPKVSCMGRVRSKRGRRRSSEQKKAKEKTMENSTRKNTLKKAGFIAGIIAVFRRRREKPVRSEAKVKKPAAESPPRKSAAGQGKEIQASIPATIEPPSLGAMAKLASGRRSWSAEVVV